MEAGICEPKVLDFCHSLYKEGCRSPHLLAYLVDAAIERLEHGDPNASQLKENAKKVMILNVLKSNVNCIVN